MRSKDLSNRKRTLAGNSSWQFIQCDLTIGADFGGDSVSSPKFGGAVMGALFNDATLTNGNNFLFGLCGSLNITGTRISKYAQCAQLARLYLTAAGDGFVAMLDGDEAATIGDAAFAARMFNSNSGSKWKIGLDLYHDAATETGLAGYKVQAIDHDIRFSNGVKLVALTSAITANVTTTSETTGTLGITSNATGRGTIFYSDGSKWQLQP